MARSVFVIAAFACICSTFVHAQSNLTAVLQSQPDLSQLAAALQLVPDLATYVASGTNFTILAPVDSAFAAIPPDTQESVSLADQDPDGISTIIAYHVLNGSYPSTAFTEIPNYVPSVFNQSYAIYDTVRTNVTRGQNVGLVLNEGNATIISGELQTCNVIEADIDAGNGIVIHKVDRLLTIPLNTTLMSYRLEQTAVIGALTATGLIETIDTVDDLTLFIPSNAAFEAAGSAFVNATQEQLSEVLTYHAVTESVLFANQVINTSVASLEGTDLTLTVSDEGDIFVNSARVILPNILLSNGVAHLIDTVLNPNAFDTNRDDLRGDPSASATPAFSGATAISGSVPFTTAAQVPSTTISIPALATTADVVSEGTGSASSSGSPSASVSATGFTGGANLLDVNPAMIVAVAVAAMFGQV